MYYRVPEGCVVTINVNFYACAIRTMCACVCKNKVRLIINGTISSRVHMCVYSASTVQRQELAMRLRNIESGCCVNACVSLRWCIVSQLFSELVPGN